MSAHSNTQTESKTPVGAMRQEAQRHIGDIKVDIAAVRKDLTALTTDAAELAGSTARKGAAAAVDSARHLADRADDGYQQAISYVRRHPTASLLVAVGAGAILGRIFLHRRS